MGKQKERMKEGRGEEAGRTSGPSQMLMVRARYSMFGRRPVIGWVGGVGGVKRGNLSGGVMVIMMMA